MVIHFEWHRTAMEQKSWSSLPVTGEDTGLEALASPLVGYLGKVQQRALSLEFCPWCSSKGLTYGLHLYRINFHESITLCTNPECLFPLVSQPLEDVLASLVPDEPPLRGKRKRSAGVDQEELINSAHKHLRSEELDARLVQEECSAVNCDNSRSTEKRSEMVNGYPRDSSVTADLDSVWNEHILSTETAACEDLAVSAPCSTSAGIQQSSSQTLFPTNAETARSPHGSPSPITCGFDLPQEQSKHCFQDPHQAFNANNEAPTAAPLFAANAGSASHKSIGASVPPFLEEKGVGSLACGSSSTMVAQSAVFVPIPDKLFWSNSNNLCWLDSMLVALVNCEGLRKHQPQDKPLESSVWQLIKEYEAVCTAVEVHQQPGRDGTMRVPQDVLQKAHQDLHSLRMSIFKLLQPKLQCNLGQRETPVFALQLLLSMDLWAEPLFQLTFQWEFACSGCQIVTRERVTKSLPTLTNILPEWSPLNAVHFAPCNACGRKNQRRALVLERTPPVLALHFVQGLPDNNIRKYAFTFKGMHYRVTTVIQYDLQLQHFVTWVACSDGSWLEFDDLKHQECKRHQIFPVRAKEIHIVFWEGEQAPGPPATGSPSLNTPVNLSHGDDAVSEEPAENSLLSHTDTDIVCALTTVSAAEEEGSSTTGALPAAAADTSIDSAMLLDTFEGLSHDDIVTLTLVDITAQSDVQALSTAEQTKGVDQTADTSRIEEQGRVPGGVQTEWHVVPDTPGPEDSSAHQPSSSPSPPSPLTAGRRWSSAISRPPQKKEPQSGAATPSKSLLQTSPVSSTNPSAPSSPLPPSPPLSLSPPPPTAPPVTTASLLTSRWSFLLSRHPKQAANKADGNVTLPPGTRPNRGPPTQSTPDPARRPTPLFAKPPPPQQMKTEASEGLPLKAAEMYEGFGTKSSQNRPPPPTPEQPASRPSQPHTSLHHKPMSTPVAAGAPLSAAGRGGLTETLLKKRHTSKPPPGLSEKEVQRYKQMKKLKAMKKKLAKLNQLLGHQDWPDSTNADSPTTVTSSTYEGSISDDLLLDLLSPATTASNLSPDSTGFLEMIANGQEGGEQPEARAAPSPQVDHANPAENFLEDFLSQAVAQRPSEIEAEMLSALDLFV